MSREKKEDIMKVKITIISLFILSCFIFLTGCQQKKAIEQTVLNNKELYVGDNTSVYNLVNSLNNNDYFDMIELQTKEAPYGVIITYNNHLSNDEHRKIALNNATYILAFVHNADWVNFKWKKDQSETTVTREQLTKLYENDLMGSYTEKELNQWIQEKLAHPKLLAKIWQE